MRIAFIIGQFPTLSETFILNQITGLIDRGHEVEIFASGKRKESKVHSDVEKYDLLSRTHYRHMPGNKLWRVIKAIGLIVINFYKNPVAILKSLNVFKYGKSALSLELLYAAIPFLGKGPFDIIHCHFGPNGSLGVLLREIGATKGGIVTTFHGYDTRLGVANGGDMYRQLFEKGDLFLAGTAYNHKNLVNFGVDKKRITYHPVGIDTAKFPYKPRVNPRHDLRQIRVLTVARLVEEKGLQYAIKAIKVLLSRHPDLDLKYTIVGGGKLELELQRLIETLGIKDSVNLTGPLDQEGIRSELGENHIFLLPSIAESFGVVLLEAQAVGLPIIATSVGSVDQAIVDGKSGFLVPPGDVDALVERLEYLTDHPKIWPEMGRVGRKFVEEHYNIDKLNDRLVEIYRKLLDGELP